MHIFLLWLIYQHLILGLKLIYILLFSMLAYLFPYQKACLPQTWREPFVLGDTSSGKTTLIARLQGNEEPEKGSGIEFTHLTVSDEYRDGKGHSTLHWHLVRSRLLWLICGQRRIVTCDVSWRVTYRCFAQTQLSWVCGCWMVTWRTLAFWSTR